MKEKRHSFGSALLSWVKSKLVGKNEVNRNEKILNPVKYPESNSMKHRQSYERLQLNDKTEKYLLLNDRVTKSQSCELHTNSFLVVGVEELLTLNKNRESKIIHNVNNNYMFDKDEDSNINDNNNNTSSINSPSEKYKRFAKNSKSFSHSNINKKNDQLEKKISANSDSIEIVLIEIGEKLINDHENEEFNLDRKKRNSKNVDNINNSPSNSNNLPSNSNNLPSNSNNSPSITFDTYTNEFNEDEKIINLKQYEKINCPNIDVESNLTTGKFSCNTISFENEEEKEVLNENDNLISRNVVFTLYENNDTVCRAAKSDAFCRAEKCKTVDNLPYEDMIMSYDRLSNTYSQKKFQTNSTGCILNASNEQHKSNNGSNYDIITNSGQSRNIIRLKIFKRKDQIELNNYCDKTSVFEYDLGTVDDRNNFHENTSSQMKYSNIYSNEIQKKKFNESDYKNTHQNSNAVKSPTRNNFSEMNDPLRFDSVINKSNVNESFQKNLVNDLNTTIPLQKTFDDFENSEESDSLERVHKIIADYDASLLKRNKSKNLNQIIKRKFSLRSQKKKIKESDRDCSDLTYRSENRSSNPNNFALTNRYYLNKFEIMNPDKSDYFDASYENLMKIKSRNNSSIDKKSYKKVQQQNYILENNLPKNSIIKDTLDNSRNNDRTQLRNYGNIKKLENNLEGVIAVENRKSANNDPTETSIDSDSLKYNNSEWSKKTFSFERSKKKKSVENKEKKLSENSESLERISKKLRNKMGSFSKNTEQDVRNLNETTTSNLRRESKEGSKIFNLNEPKSNMDSKSSESSLNNFYRDLNILDYFSNLNASEADDTKDGYVKYVPEELSLILNLKKNNNNFSNTSLKAERDITNFSNNNDSNPNSFNQDEVRRTEISLKENERHSENVGESVFENEHTPIPEVPPRTYKRNYRQKEHYDVSRRKLSYGKEENTEVKYHVKLGIDEINKSAEIELEDDKTIPKVPSRTYKKKYRKISESFHTYKTLPTNRITLFDNSCLPVNNANPIRYPPRSQQKWPASQGSETSTKFMNNVKCCVNEYNTLSTRQNNLDAKFVNNLKSNVNGYNSLSTRQDNSTVHSDNNIKYNINGYNSLSTRQDNSTVNFDNNIKHNVNVYNSLPIQEDNSTPNSLTYKVSSDIDERDYTIATCTDFIYVDEIRSKTILNEKLRNRTKFSNFEDASRYESVTNFDEVNGDNNWMMLDTVKQNHNLPTNAHATYDDPTTIFPCQNNNSKYNNENDLNLKNQIEDSIKELTSNNQFNTPERINRSNNQFNASVSTNRSNNRNRSIKSENIYDYNFKNGVVFNRPHENKKIELITENIFPNIILNDTIQDIQVKYKLNDICNNGQIDNNDDLINQAYISNLQLNSICAVVNNIIDSPHYVPMNKSQFTFV